MQKKMILPVAVLSLTMLAATACAPNGDQGMGTTNQGYSNGYNKSARYMNDNDFNRVTNNYGYNTNRSNWNNTAMDRGNNNQFHNFNRTSTNNVATPMGDFGNTNGNFGTTNTAALSNKIAKTANGVRGVDSVKTLIVGNTVYVGLDVDSRVSRRNATRVEQEVHRVLSKAYPGYDVRVTSDRALFQRTGTFFNNDQNNFNMWNRTTGANMQ